MKKKLILALLASAAAISAPSISEAQTYTRLISFGDSLSDNGNLFALTANPPVPYNKRFTNRLVFTEYLSGQTSNLIGGYLTATTATLNNTGNINYAFGGARTDTAPNSNGPIPSTGVQISTYLSRGGTFGANDVVTLWGGANNIFQGPAAATATAAATDIITQTGQLATAGAKNIVVMNLPDLGLAPAFFNTANQSGMSQLSGLFNSTLATGLNNLAVSNPNANIITVDVASLFQAIIRNPSAFGLSNVTSQCILVTACVTGTAATQDTYLFWDSVHPTATGQQLVAKAVTQYLYTPTLTTGVGMFSDVSYANRHNELQNMAMTMASANGQKGLFMQVIGNNGSRDTTISTQSFVGGSTVSISDKAYDFTSSGLRIGTIQNLGENSSWGVSLSAAAGSSKAFMVSADTESLNIDGGMNFRMDDSFVVLTAGFGVDTFKDYQRDTTLDPIKITAPRIRAMSISTSAEYGRNMDMGGFKLTPVGRLSYVRAKMDGFAETGVFDTVQFYDREASAVSAGLELRAHGKLSDTTTLYGLLGYEAVVSGESDFVTGKLINNSAKAYATGSDEVADSGLLVGAGISRDMGGGYMFTVGYRGNFGDNSQANHTAKLSVAKHF